MQTTGSKTELVTHLRDLAKQRRRLSNGMTADHKKIHRAYAEGLEAAATAAEQWQLTDEHARPVVRPYSASDGNPMAELAQGEHR